MREYLHTKMARPAGHDLTYHGKRVDFETMKKELGLSPAQEQTVSSALDDYAKYYQNLDEQRADVAEAGKRRILSVLDENQKQRFYRLFNEPPAQR